jgi:hypothetical protein
MKRGVTLSVAMLSGSIMAQSVQAAPVGVVAVITGAAIKGTATGAAILTIVKGTLQMMLWNKLKGICAWFVAPIAGSRRCAAGGGSLHADSGPAWITLDRCGSVTEGKTPT